MPGAAGVLPVNRRDFPPLERPVDPKYFTIEFVAALTLVVGAITLAIICMASAETPVAGDDH